VIINLRLQELRASS